MVSPSLAKLAAAEIVLTGYSFPTRMVLGVRCCSDDCAIATPLGIGQGANAVDMTDMLNARLKPIVGILPMQLSSIISLTRQSEISTVFAKSKRSESNVIRGGRGSIK